MNQRALTPLLDADETNELLKKVYPQLNDEFDAYRAVEVFPGGCVVRLNATEKHLRPGNTVSGPSLFTLADIGGYVCVLSHAGPDALSVTTNLNINFMRKAEAGPIDGRCRILKLGRNLMVFDIDMVAGPDRAIVAHATGSVQVKQVSLAPVELASHGPSVNDVHGRLDTWMKHGGIVLLGLRAIGGVGKSHQMRVLRARWLSAGPHEILLDGGTHTGVENVIDRLLRAVLHVPLSAPNEEVDRALVAEGPVDR
jgi:uncharacterized protein (TIGR00369 family)